MFFSCATREMCTSTGRSAAMPCRRGTRAVAAAEAPQVDAGRQHLGARRDAVAAQHRQHLPGRHDQRVDLGALRGAESPRRAARRGARQERHVVVQVLLEERVVGLDDRHAEAPRERDTGVVRHERRVHVDDVEAARRELGRECARTRRGPSGGPRGRVARRARDADHAGLGARRRRVGGRHQVMSWPSSVRLCGTWRSTSIRR